jgi:hypothetical protein
MKFELHKQNSRDFYKCYRPNIVMPVTVAGRSKACTVFARSEAVIVGSKPTQGMDL